MGVAVALRSLRRVAKGPFSRIEGLRRGLYPLSEVDVAFGRLRLEQRAARLTDLVASATGT